MNDMCPGYCPGDSRGPGSLACAVIDRLSDGIVLLDAQARVLHLNRAAEHLFGCAMPEAVDQPLCDLLHGCDCEGEERTGELCRVADSLRTLAHGASHMLWQSEFKHRNQGPFPAEIELSRLNTAPPISYLARLRRIDEQLATENQLGQAVLDKIRAETRYRSKNQFFANMSHDLRTPLNAILGFCELLLSDAQDGGLQHIAKDLEQIQQASQHMMGLVNQLLDLAKIEAGHMNLHLDWIELTPLLERTVATVMPLAATQGNRLRIHDETAAMRLFADQTKLRQILFNLLGNACKFTRNGDILLSAKASDLEGKAGVRLAVADTGIGMTGEQIQRLFTPYIQADPSIAQQYGGTGLGLCISKLFCEMMGGHMEVASEAGQGTTFTFWLPLEANPQALPVELEHEIATVTTHSRRITTQEGTERRRKISTVLAIEDDPLFSEQVSRILVRDDFRAVAALNPHDGLKLAREIRPSVILLDVMMADMDGWAVLKEIKADPDLAPIPVIMLTLLDDKGIAFSLGASDYVQKPVDREPLLASIKKWVRRVRADRVMVFSTDVAQRLDLTLRLRDAGFSVEQAGNLEHARDCLQRRDPALIVFDAGDDLQLGQGFLSLVSGEAGLAKIPLLALTQGSTPASKRLVARARHCIPRDGLSADALWQELARHIQALLKQPGETLQANAPI